jgi:septal ring-binding cell division protein DamX
MSTETAPHPPPQAPADNLCLHCGSELADDQEWCLECGSARTLIHRPPDWRIPLAVIGAVVLAALLVFAIVLVNLSGDANQSANAAVNAAAASTSTATVAAAPVQSTATTASTATATAKTKTSTASTATSTPLPPTVTAGLPGWPVGLPGWTVVLARSRNRATAYIDAQRVASAGIQAGVLDSSLHPHLRPGFWLVFSGRYPTKSQALAATTQLISLGQPHAHPRLVGRPGT